MVETLGYERMSTPTTLEEALVVIKGLRRAIDEREAELAKNQFDTHIHTMLNKRATEQLIESHIEEGRSFGIFLVDLNNFKLVNDTFGHLVGDQLLESLGRHLHEGFRRSEDEIGLVNIPQQGRIGGDEFMIVADLSSSNSRRETNSHRQMDKLYDHLRVIEKTFVEDSSSARTLGVGFSIGTAVFDPKHPVSAATLIEMADEAMYEEKETLKTGIAPWSANASVKAHPIESQRACREYGTIA